MRRAPSFSILGVVVLGLVACGRPYDPAGDRKIPRPPRVLTWTHEAVFDATPEQVWAVITDFDGYEAWNPWILRARGPVEVGARVDIEVRLGDDTRTMWHRIVELTPHRRFCWRDGGATTAFVTGLRCRELSTTDDARTHLRQVLTVGGAFRGRAQARYDAALRTGLAQETEAIGAELRHRMASR